MKALLVVIALTLAPIQAWADCAWVLWFTSGKTSGITSPTNAFPTRAECVQAAAHAMKTAVADYKRQHPDDYAYVTCLPDTIDPRGPKAGGR